jgi:hypothetical protein
MAELNDLDCKLFVETDTGLENLNRCVGRALSVPAESRVGQVLRVPSGELEVRANEDRQAARIADFPDGFLFFRYLLEYYPYAHAERQERVALISRLLNFLWANGWAAVAACDYEEDLPHRGGYADGSLPWPSRNGAPPNGGANASIPAEQGPAAGA